MGLPRQEHWSGLPLPSPGELPYLVIKPASPAWQADSLLPCPWEALSENGHSLLDTQRLKKPQVATQGWGFARVWVRLALAAK